MHTTALGREGTSLSVAKRYGSRERGHTMSHNAMALGREDPLSVTQRYWLLCHTMLRLSGERTLSLSLSQNTMALGREDPLSLSLSHNTMALWREGPSLSVTQCCGSRERGPSLPKCSVYTERGSELDYVPHMRSEEVINIPHSLEN